MGLGTGQTLEKERKNNNKQFIEGVEVLKILRLQVKKEKVLAEADQQKTEGKVRKEGERSNENRGLGNK